MASTSKMSINEQERKQAVADHPEEIEALNDKELGNQRDVSSSPGIAYVMSSDCDDNQAQQVFLDRIRRNVTKASDDMPKEVPLTKKLSYYMLQCGSDVKSENAYVKVSGEDFSMLKLGSRYDTPTSWHDIPVKGFVKNRPYLYGFVDKTVMLWKLTEEPSDVRRYTLDDSIVAIHGLEWPKEISALHSVQQAVIVVTSQSLVLLGWMNENESTILKKLDEQWQPGVSCCISKGNKTFLGDHRGEVFLYECTLAKNWITWSYFALSKFSSEEAPIKAIRLSNDGKLLLTVSAANSFSLYNIDDEPWKTKPLLEMKQVDLLRAGCSALSDVQALVTEKNDYILTATCSSSFKRILMSVDIKADTLDIQSMLTAAVHKMPPGTSKDVICKFVSHPSGVSVAQTHNKVVVATSQGVLAYDQGWKEALEVVKVHGNIRDIDICVTVSSNGQLQVEILIATDTVVFSYGLMASKDLISSALMDESGAQEAMSRMPAEIIREQCLKILTSQGESKVLKAKATAYFIKASAEQKILSMYNHVAKVLLSQPGTIVATISMVENRIETMYNAEPAAFQTKLNMMSTAVCTLLMTEGFEQATGVHEVQEFVTYCSQVVGMLDLLKCESIILDPKAGNFTDLVIKKVDLFFTTLPSNLALFVAKNVTGRALESVLKFVDRLSNACPMVFNFRKSAAVQGNYCLQASINEKDDFSQKSRLLQKSQAFLEQAQAICVNRESMVKDLIGLGAYHSLGEIYCKMILNEEFPSMATKLWSELEAIMLDLQSADVQQGEHHYQTLLHVVLQEGKASLRSKVYERLYQTQQLDVLENTATSLLKGLDRFLAIRLMDKNIDSGVWLGAVLCQHKLAAKSYSDDKKKLQQAFKLLKNAIKTPMLVGLAEREHLLQLAMDFAKKHPASLSSEIANLKSLSQLLVIQVKLLAEAEKYTVCRDNKISILKTQLGLAADLMEHAVRLQLPQSFLRLHLLENSSCDPKTSKAAWTMISQNLERLKFDDARDYMEDLATEFKGCIQLKSSIELLEGIFAEKGGDHSSLLKMFLRVAGIFTVTKIYLDLISEANSWSPTSEAIVRSALMLSKLLSEGGQHPPYAKNLVRKSIAMMERLGAAKDQKLYFEMSMMRGRTADVLDE